MKLITRASILFVKHILLRSLHRDADNPDRCQTAVLNQILKKNRNTDFGRQYSFASIARVSEYFRRVPVCGYEDIRPYIDRQVTTGRFALVTQKPVMYAQTSGTTGLPKYIPVLRDTLRSYRRAQRIFSYVQYRDVPGLFSGKLLAIVSPAVEGHLQDGTPFGSMSGLVYQNMPDIILSRYVLPPSVFGIADYETKYRLMAALAVREGKISCIATANPSTLIKLSGIIRRDFDLLLRFVKSGDLTALDVRLDDVTRKALTPYSTPLTDRARYLEECLRDKDFSFARLWPRLRGVVCWTSGNCALLLPALRKLLSPQTAIIEMGYLSSEFRGTITIDCTHNLGVPTLQDNFFEFAEVNAWDAGSHETVLLSGLVTGKKYYVIVTTPNGLYRYFINDIIEVTGRFQNTPTVAFVQKGKGVTNLTGEKLYESQVVTAIVNTLAPYDLEPVFFIMLANRVNNSYTLYLEITQSYPPAEFAAQLTDHLRNLNIEYKAKLDSGRLEPVIVKHLKAGTLEDYKRHCLKSGQREAQFKVVKLQYRQDVDYSFESRCV